MSDQTPSDALNEWFRRVGANMGRYDYESGVKAIHDLTESNRRLANQIVGYGDRMQQTIAGIVKTAKVEALREAVSDFEAHVGVGEFAELSKRGPLPWGHIEEAWEHQGPYMDWLRTRADQLEAS